VKNEWAVVQNLKGRATREVTSVVWNEDGTRLAISTRSGEVKVWRIENNVGADEAVDNLPECDVLVEDSLLPGFAQTENADRAAYLATISMSTQGTHKPPTKRMREPRGRSKTKMKLARLAAQELEVQEGLVRATEEAEKILREHKTEKK